MKGEGGIVPFLICSPLKKKKKKTGVPTLSNDLGSSSPSVAPRISTHCLLQTSPCLPYAPCTAHAHRIDVRAMKRPRVRRVVKARATAAKRHVKAACWCIRSRGRPERLWSKRKRRSACLFLLSVHRCFYTRMFGGTCQRSWLTCTTNYTRCSFVRVWARSCICVLRVRGSFACVHKTSQSLSALGKKKKKKKDPN